MAPGVGGRGPGHDLSKAIEKDLGGLEAFKDGFSKLAATMNAVVAENREPLRDFTSGGLYELANVLAEMRQLIVRLNRVTTQVERDPARFLFGDPQEGYEANDR